MIKWYNCSFMEKAKAHVYFYILYDKISINSVYVKEEEIVQQ